MGNFKVKESHRLPRKQRKQNERKELLEIEEKIKDPVYIIIYIFIIFF